MSTVFGDSVICLNSIKITSVIFFKAFRNLSKIVIKSDRLTHKGQIKLIYKRVSRGSFATKFARS